MNQETETKKSPVIKYIGCGCLAMVVIVAVVGALGVMGIGKALKSNSPYKDSIVAVQSNAAAIEVLGEPIKPGFMPSGKINVVNDGGTVSFSIPVSGPKGEGVVIVEGNKEAGIWKYETWHLKADGLEGVIKLSKE